MKISSKSLLLIIYITIITVMLYGFTGTGAWFSDLAENEPDFVYSGTLDLNIHEAPMDEVNLVPGEDYKVFSSFCLRNEGTIGLKFQGLFKAEEDLRQEIIPYLTVKQETKSPDGWVILREIFGTPEPDQESDALAHYFNLPGQDEEFDRKNILDGFLVPDEEICYRLSIKLDPETPNDLQGTVLDFYLPVFATQTNNPGWD